MPTSTVENYLKAIFTLAQGPSGEGGRVGADGRSEVGFGPIGEELGVTPGTVTTMMKQLDRDGLVVYEPRKSVRLTAKGRRAACRVLRRHRLIEQFLVEVMGLGWDEVHEDAEVLEHAVSDRLVERIDVMLGRPEYDPHGDPIPDAEGKLPNRRLILLSDAEPGGLRMARVIDHDPAFLSYLQQQGLSPGVELELLERDLAADTVTVRLVGEGAACITLSAAAAGKLLVTVDAGEAEPATV